MRRQLGCLRHEAGSGADGRGASIVIACNAAVAHLAIRIAHGAAFFIRMRNKNGQNFGWERFGEGEGTGQRAFPHHLIRM